MATLEQLQTWLTEAQNALHEIVTGDKVVEIDREGKGSTTYQRASVPQLKSYIRDLENQIAVKNGTKKQSRQIHAGF